MSKSRPGKPRRRKDAAAELRKLYDQVPDVGCRGTCQDTCTEFLLPRVERRRIVERTGVSINLAPPPPGSPVVRQRCPLLTQFGQCSVYDIRPLICRIWGASEVAPCNYGCRPAEGSRLLTIKEAYGLMGEAYRISGQDSMADQYAAVADLPDERVAEMAPAMRAYVWGQRSLQETIETAQRIRRRWE